MSDYILPEVWENPTSMEVPGVASINLQLVHVLNKLYLKVTNLSNFILFRHQMVSRQLSCWKN